MIKAFHVNWTAPFSANNPAHKKRDYYLEDFEILTTILSALKWRQYNGTIKLYTDDRGVDYYNRLGITDLWDRGIDVEVLESIEIEINPAIFWAGGKLFALQKEMTPIVMVDTDFIVWESLTEVLQNHSLAVIHRESLTDVYPEKEMLTISPSYQFLEGLPWDSLPCNTAFAYVSDEAFKEHYTTEAIRFMEGNIKDSLDKISRMVFAEQRLFAMCAKEKSIPIFELMPRKYEKWKDQVTFTHIWGYKQHLKNNRKERLIFCLNCLKRIITDFPEYEQKLHKIAILSDYLKWLI